MKKSTVTSAAIGSMMGIALILPTFHITNWQFWVMILGHATLVGLHGTFVTEEDKK